MWTGKGLYDLFNEVGVRGDDWEDLDDQEQEAWEYLSVRLSSGAHPR